MILAQLMVNGIALGAAYAAMFPDTRITLRPRARSIRMPALAGLPAIKVVAVFSTLT